LGMLNWALKTEIAPLEGAIFLDSNLFKKQNVVIRNLHILAFLYCIYISNNFRKIKMFSSGTQYKQNKDSKKNVFVIV
jgi:hypothetical protein